MNPNKVKERAEREPCLQGVRELLEHGAGQPVAVQGQGLQAGQAGQCGQQQQEGLVRQLGEAHLQAHHAGRVATQVPAHALHVPGHQRDA